MKTADGGVQAVTRAVQVAWPLLLLVSASVGTGFKLPRPQPAPHAHAALAGRVAGVRARSECVGDRFRTGRVGRPIHHDHRRRAAGCRGNSLRCCSAEYREARARRGDASLAGVASSRCCLEAGGLVSGGILHLRLQHRRSARIVDAPAFYMAFAKMIAGTGRLVALPGYDSFSWLACWPN